MILHIPHAKTAIPEDELREFCIPDLDEELSKMTDRGADKVFQIGERIEFPYSRLLCDVERFADGDDMENIGMGVCYTHTADGRRMRFVTKERREALMKRYYYPHHLRLENAVKHEISTLGRCLIIDCHSFPEAPLPYEQDTLRPDFCIGFDKRCADIGLKVASSFQNMGYEIGINRPFAGALLPTRYSDDPRVQSVMIEVNRGIVDLPRTEADVSEVLSLMSK